MKQGIFNGKIIKKIEIRMDYMNRNTIVGLAMLCAYSETKHQDLLDLIAPFVLYVVGKTAKLDSEIDMGQVCEYLDVQFGFKGIQSSVVKKILQREKKVIRCRNQSCYLVSSLGKHVDQFDEKRTNCKVQSDAVTTELTIFLNEAKACGRMDYTQAECENLLLMFFDRKGDDVLQSVEMLYQMTSKKDEIYYYIAKFILKEYERNSVLMDYITSLVKGYYVTSAIYLHIENPNIKSASFKDVTFYLDTRILLALLGLKSKEENDSVCVALDVLQRNGAKLACFNYNLDEVESILQAYKNSLLSPYVRPSNYTLEYLDEQRYSSSQVETLLQAFRKSLKSFHHIDNGDVDSLIQHLDQQRIIELVQQIKPNYNTDKLANDIYAIDVVKQRRNGHCTQAIETCKAVFVTTNTVFIKAIKSYMKETSSNGCFPHAISVDELCVLAWIKDFKRPDEIPKMRLLENVTAAMKPSTDLMNEFFDQLDVLKAAGEFSDDDVAQLRVNAYARYELMDITHGSKEAVTADTISAIYSRVNKKAEEQGYERGRADAERQSRLDRETEHNSACKKIRERIEREYQSKQSKYLFVARVVVLIVAVAFSAATGIGLIYDIMDQGLSIWPTLMLLLVTGVSWYQAILPFLNRENWLAKQIKRKCEQKKDKEISKEIEKYLALYS